jgi:hypothetical protein
LTPTATIFGAKAAASRTQPRSSSPLPAGQMLDGDARLAFAALEAMRGAAGRKTGAA